MAARTHEHGLSTGMKSEDDKVSLDEGGLATLHANLSFISKTDCGMVSL